MRSRPTPTWRCSICWLAWVQGLISSLAASCRGCWRREAIRPRWSSPGWPRAKPRCASRWIKRSSVSIWNRKPSWSVWTGWRAAWARRPGCQCGSIRISMPVLIPIYLPASSRTSSAFPSNRHPPSTARRRPWPTSRSSGWIAISAPSSPSSIPLWKRLTSCCGWSTSWRQTASASITWTWGAA